MVGNHDPLSKASLNQINHPACNRRRGLEYRGRSEDRVEAKVEEVVGGGEVGLRRNVEKREEKRRVWYVGHVRGTAANVCCPHKLTAASDFT